MRPARDCPEARNREPVGQEPSEHPAMRHGIASPPSSRLGDTEGAHQAHRPHLASGDNPRLCSQVKSARCQQGSRTVSAVVTRPWLRLAYDLTPGTYTITNDGRTLADRPPRRPRLWWSRPMRADVCSMFARMSRYAPAASGIRSAPRIPASGQNGSSRHVSAPFGTRSEGKIRTEQRTLNPRVRSRWLPALSLSPRSGCCCPCHAACWTAQIAPPLPGLAARPVSRVSRARCGIRPAQPALPAPMQNIWRSRAHEKPSAGTSELHARAAPQARGSGMAVRMLRAARRPPQRAAPPTERPMQPPGWRPSWHPAVAAPWPPPRCASASKTRAPPCQEG